jgi:hypothetical protein
VRALKLSMIFFVLNDTVTLRLCGWLFKCSNIGFTCLPIRPLDDAHASALYGIQWRGRFPRCLTGSRSTSSVITLKPAT